MIAAEKNGKKRHTSPPKSGNTTFLFLIFSYVLEEADSVHDRNFNKNEREQKDQGKGNCVCVQRAEVLKRGAAGTPGVFKGRVRPCSPHTHTHTHTHTGHIS